MQIGDRVEVHTKFNDSWTAGFEIAEIIPEGYRVRRVSDGTWLPDSTSAADLRSADASASRPPRHRAGHRPL